MSRMRAISYDGMYRVGSRVFATLEEAEKFATCKKCQEGEYPYYIPDDHDTIQYVMRSVDPAEIGWHLAAVKPDFAEQQKQKILHQLAPQKWWKQKFDPRPIQEGDVVKLTNPIPAKVSSLNNETVKRLWLDAGQESFPEFVDIEAGSLWRVDSIGSYSDASISPVGPVYISYKQDADSSRFDSDAYAKATLEPSDFDESLPVVVARINDVATPVQRATPYEGDYAGNTNLEVFQRVIDHLPPEAATIYKWIADQMRQGKFDPDEPNAFQDLARAIPYVEWQRMYGNNDDLTGNFDFQAKNANITDLARWVRSLEQLELDPETNVIPWNAEPVWTDPKTGWTITPLAEEEFNRQGKCMNHCYAEPGSEYQSKYAAAINDDDVSIEAYALRDKTGRPRGTTFIGKQDFTQDHPYGQHWTIIESRANGSLDRGSRTETTRKPAEVLDRWYADAEQAGVTVDRDTENVHAGYEHPNFPVGSVDKTCEEYDSEYTDPETRDVSNTNDLWLYLDDLRRKPYEFDADEDPYEWDEEQCIAYYSPGEVPVAEWDDLLEDVRASLPEMNGEEAQDTAIALAMLHEHSEGQARSAPSLSQMAEMLVPEQVPQDEALFNRDEYSVHVKPTDPAQLLAWALRRLENVPLEPMYPDNGECSWAIEKNLNMIGNALIQREHGSQAANWRGEAFTVEHQPAYPHAYFNNGEPVMPHRAYDLPQYNHGDWVLNTQENNNEVINPHQITAVERNMKDSGWHYGYDELPYRRFPEEQLTPHTPAVEASWQRVVQWKLATPKKSPKFSSSGKKQLEAHKKGKRVKSHNYVHHKKASLTPEQVEQYIQQNGPYLYHLIHGEGQDPHEVLQSILRNGILPRSETGNAAFDDYLASRPGHAYIGNEQLMNDHVGGISAPQVRVDLRRLDPSLLDTDEDHALSAMERPDSLMTRKAFPGRENVYPATWKSWDQPNQTPYANIGEWADEHSHVIDQPEWTADSLNRGSVAVRGGIPPEAVEINPHWAAAQKQAPTLPAVQSSWRKAADDYRMQHQPSPEGAWRRVAMPWVNNVWYHVTASWHLSDIAENGLQGRASHGNQNFWVGQGSKLAPLESIGHDEGVYLWPTIVEAQQYAYSDMQNFGEGNHVILRVSNLDYTQVYPDQECLAHWFESQLGQDQEWVHQNNEGDPLYDWWFANYPDEIEDGSIDFSEALDAMMNMPSELRREMAEEIAENGDGAVFYLGIIPPNQIEIAEYQDINAILEGFKFEKPEPDWQENPDAYTEWEDERQQGQEEYLENLAAQGIELGLDLSEFKEMVSDQQMNLLEQMTPRSEDPLSNQYKYTPLRQYEGSWRKQATNETLYHITDNNKFALDPNREPTDNAFSIEDRSGRKGIYLTSDPDTWRANGYHRPYVAEIQVPEGLAAPERWHGERFLPAEHFDKANVSRVMPFDVYQQEKYGEPGTVEDALGTPASTPPDKDVRDFTPEEHLEHLQRLRDYLHDVQGWGWNEFDEQGHHVGVDETDSEGMPIRRDRNGEVMTRGRYAGWQKEAEANIEGALVALWVDPATASQLAVPGGEDPANMHISLLYLSDNAAAISEEQWNIASEAIQSVSERLHGLSGRITGVGSFPANDEGEVPWYANVDVPGLKQLHDDLKAKFSELGWPIDEKFPTFKPHVTLIYTPEGEPGPQNVPNLPISFTAITLAQGDSKQAYPMGQSLVAASWKKQSMALRPDQIQTYIDRFGPYLYHVTEGEPWTEGKRSLADIIQENGLQGTDDYHPQRSVYLSPTPWLQQGDSGRFSDPDRQQAVFRVDIRDLDPSKIEADEWQMAGEKDWPWYFNEYAAHEDPKAAEALGDPETTWRSLTQVPHPAIGYRGDIAPEHLKRMSTKASWRRVG